MFMNTHELLEKCKKIKKQNGKSDAINFYQTQIFSTEFCPTCKVTGKKLSYYNWSEYFTICGAAVKNVLKKYNKDIQKAKEILNSEYIFVEELGGFYPNFRSLSTAIGKRKIDSSLNVILYEKYFKEKTKCCFPKCDKKVPYEKVQWNACCDTHYNQFKTIKTGKKKIEDYSIECKECNEFFINSSHLTYHIEKMHMSSEEYYNKYISNIKGSCKWCEKPTKFKTINKGYDSFCYNTDCNVNYYNKYHNRHQCGDKISKSLVENKNSPTQKEYWMKKGMNEENAIKMVSERQTTNSINAIMKRNKCSRKEANQIRKEITKKWLESFPNLNYSSVSQELFWEIYKKIKDQYKEIYFATLSNGEKDDSGKNHEYKVSTESSYKKLDFYVKDINKAIEFQGTYWHSERNTRDNFSPEKDIIRESQIISSIGCKILNIKEEDYNKNKEKTIQQCVDFLLNEK
jgi:hypothetical protein